MALLTSVPLSAPLYCEIVAKIREKFPDSVIVAKTSLSADEARTAYPHARVIPARANPVPSASPSPSDQSVLKVVERFLKRVGRSSLMPYFQQEYDRGRRVNKLGAIRAAIRAPGRIYGLRYVQSLGVDVDRRRKEVFSGPTVSPDEAHILFPANGDPDLLAAEIFDHGFDVILQLGWGLVSRKLITAPYWGILSWHHGVMPNIRGMVSPVWSVLKNRPDWLGVTIQRLEPGLDVGQIVSITRIDPRSVSDYTHAYITMDRAARDMIIKAVDDIHAGKDVISDPNPEPLSGVYLNIPGWWETQLFRLRSKSFFKLKS